ncbi:MAG: ferrous iron transport protein A [Rhodospirillales bacterium]|nr:ferrous iron transport protein A [Rhodospirillales bacterium]
MDTALRTEKAAASTQGLTSLARLGPGRQAMIKVVGRTLDGRADGMLERRLLEIGFEEGREVEVRHVSPFGGDPIAVRVDRLNIALRRGEAAFVLVAPRPDEPVETPET